MKESDTPFYLTGGTALSRAYYSHRYSEDLVFFMTKNQDFAKHADKIIENLKLNAFYWDDDTDFIKTPDFYSLNISHKDYPTQLKIDFVNDLPVHFGQIIETDLFYRTDSMTSNTNKKKCFQ